MSDSKTPAAPTSPASSQRVGTFTFLETTEHGITLELVDQLVEGRTLSDQDAGIVDDIRRSLTETGKLPYSWTPQEANHLRHQPTEKWLDYLVYRYKFSVFPRDKIVADFPVYLLIEPASVCNLRCVMCFQVDKSFTRKPFMGLMDMGLFREVVDEAAEGGTQAITLASRGEPTLHPQIGEMLEYLQGKFMEVKLTTNATRLTEELSHKVLETGVDMVVFSIDAHTKELYEQIRVNGVFEEVRDNIIRFHDIREKHYPNATTSSRVSAVRFREDQDKDAFTAFWRPIIDEVGMKDAMERWNTYENDAHPDLTSPCWFLWERLYVWFDGVTNPCDPDYKSYLSPGTVGEQTIREIWHGERLTKLREAHLQGRRGDYDPCDRCALSFE